MLQHPYLGPMEPKHDNCGQPEVRNYKFKLDETAQANVPRPLGESGKIQFPKLFFLHTYLLTYLEVINPYISETAAAIITKLYEPNASTLGSKLSEFGRNRRMSNTTSGQKCSTVTPKR